MSFETVRRGSEDEGFGDQPLGNLTDPDGLSLFLDPMVLPPSTPFSPAPSSPLTWISSPISPAPKENFAVSFNAWGRTPTSYPTSFVPNQILSPAPASPLPQSQSPQQSASAFLPSGACTVCHKAKRPCDRSRPCQRCIRLKKGHLCKERPRKRKTTKHLPPPTLKEVTVGGEKKTRPLVPTGSFGSNTMRDVVVQPEMSPWMQTEMTATVPKGVTTTRSSTTVTQNLGTMSSVKTSSSETVVVQRSGRPVDDNDWSIVWTQTMESSKDDLLKSSYFNANRELCRSLCSSLRGPARETMYRLLDSKPPTNSTALPLMSSSGSASWPSSSPSLSPSLSPPLISPLSSSPELSSPKMTSPSSPSTSSLPSSATALTTGEKDQIAPIPEGGPHPVVFTPLFSETISDPHHATVVCKFGWKQTDGQTPTHVRVEIGVNGEAERLFGYGKDEYVHTAQNYGRKFFFRLLHRDDWSRYTKTELKSMIAGENCFRLLVTCVNKWDCNIRCLMDVRYEFFQKVMHKVTFFFIPLPSQPDIGEL